MGVIIVTGSVGTGKTTLAKALSKKLNYEHIDVNKIIKEDKIYDSYDKKNKCYIIDAKKLNKSLIKLVNQYKKSSKNKKTDDKKILKNKRSEKGIIIDSHLSHYLPKKYVDLCIVTKCDLKTLEKRLKERGYGEDKVRGNLDSEIFDVCFEEAKEAGHKVFVADTTKDIKRVLNSILKKL